MSPAPSSLWETSLVVIMPTSAYMYVRLGGIGVGGTAGVGNTGHKHALCSPVVI